MTTKRERATEVSGELARELEVDRRNVAYRLALERHALRSTEIVIEPIEGGEQRYIGAKAAAARFTQIEDLLKSLIVKAGPVVLEELGYTLGLKPTGRREADASEVLRFLASKTQHVNDMSERILRHAIDWAAFDKELPPGHPWVEEMRRQGIIKFEYGRGQITEQPHAQGPAGLKGNKP